MSYLKNKNCTDYTPTCIQVYKLIRSKYGYNARISGIWQMLPDSIGIEKLELLDTKYIQNGNFESYLIDRQIDWQDGKDVDFSEVFDAILITGDFTSEEKLLLQSGNIEERLWGIFLAITNYNLNFN